MIRSYNIDDKEALLKVFKLNTNKYFDISEIHDFEKFLNDNSNTYYTIEHNNIIIGGIGYYIENKDNSGRISWIFSHPDYTGFGYGKKSVEHVLLLMSKIQIIEKQVISTSQYAYIFFQKYGYKLIKTQKDYWAKGLDLYLMEIKSH